MRAKKASDTSTYPLVENGHELQDLAEAGNELAQACFTESAYALGEVVGSLANSIDPAIVVLSGSMTRSSDQWWQSLRQGYASCAMNGVARAPIK